MTIHAPPAMVECTQLLEATITPRLNALGVEHVEIVARGVPRSARYWVGYRLAPGVQRTQRELAEEVKLYFPGALSYMMLQVVPVERLPETDPGILEEQKRLRRPTWQMFVFFGVLGAIPLTLLLGFTVFGRGDLIVSAPLRGAGASEARFVSDGKSLALWASLDGSFSRNAGSKTLNKILPVHYEIDVVHEGKLVHHLSIDTQVGRASQKLNCTMAPDCEVYLEDLPPLGSGPVLLKVQGTPREDVTRVTDMSLLVRKGTFF
ncbi:MAG: hypothetical protein IPI67_38580 [Myxococcales bacterium]|nr:hypothetical protein [Myxococcales bacterium]